MKQYLYILSLAIMLTGIYTSCKTSSLETLHQDEVAARDKYVKDNKLTDNLDVSGIYFKLTERSTDTTLIRSGFKVMLEFNITLLDGKTVVFTTEDQYGHNYEPYTFYVDVSNTIVNAKFEQQIAGLHRGLKKMHIGDRAFMVIPSELAFKAVSTTTDYVIVQRFSTLLATVYAKSGRSPAQQKEDEQQ